MFWGLIMEPNRRYSQTVQKPFHISMAALDVETSGDGPSQVICSYEGKNYLLCTLSKNGSIQCALDLEFSVGSEVAFATNGSSHIHLTGYLTTDDLYDDMDEEVEEEESDMEVLEEEKPSKRLTKAKEGPPKKKLKTDILLNSTLETEEDDSDVNLSDLSDSEDEDSLNEEEDSEVELEEEESSDEEAVVTPSAKMNGAASKKEKKKQKLVEQLQDQKKKNKENVKQQQQQQQQQKEKGSKKKETPQKDAKSPEKPGSQKKTLEGGVVVQDLKVGNGAPVKAGSFVTVYYEGRLKNNNKVFDSTLKGPGFKFRLGKREVIKGWDIGLQGMKVGGKRRIVCPPQVAYGPKGSPPIVPPMSTLIFDVEVKNAQ